MILVEKYRIGRVTILFMEKVFSKNFYNTTDKSTD